MGVLMIRCPATGVEISTGIETDQTSLDRFPDVVAHSRCPVCGGEHAWRPSQASLNETPAVPSHVAIEPPASRARSRTYF